MATSRQYVVGLDEDGRVGSRTTRIQPPGGMSHIHHDGPDSDETKNSSRILKPPGGGSSSDSVFSSAESSMASTPNDSRASSTSPKTPAKKYHLKSNFELGDEQPVNPVDAPRKRSNLKPSVNPLTGEIVGQPGKFVEAGNDLIVAKPVQRGSRVPPGGFSTPLW